MIGAALLVASWGLLPRQAQQEPPPKAIVEDYTSFSVGPVPASFGYDPTFYMDHHIPADIYHGKNIKPQRRQ